MSLKNRVEELENKSHEHANSHNIKWNIDGKILTPKVKNKPSSVSSSSDSSVDYLFKITDRTDRTDPLDPIFQANREGGTVRIGNSTQSVSENLTLQVVTSVPKYWHLKWTYNVLSSSIAEFDDPEDVIDEISEHSEQLPTSSNPIGIIWITIGVLDTIDGVFSVTNNIIESPTILVYNSCPDGVATEIT